MNPSAIIPLLDLGLSILEQYLGKLKDQLPEDVVAAVQAAIDALAAHKNDLVTKVNLEAQRR